MIFNLFKKNKQITEDLIDFSIMEISTGQIGSYIINKLYKELGGSHIGYNIFNNNGDVRCQLYGLKGNNKRIKLYFKDRCPGMIEEECKKYNSISHTFNKWDNGFEEVIYTR